MKWINGDLRGITYAFCVKILVERSKMFVSTLLRIEMLHPIIDDCTSCWLLMHGIIPLRDCSCYKEKVNPHDVKDTLRGLITRVGET
jgi:hypothetical protein